MAAAFLFTDCSDKLHAGTRALENGQFPEVILLTESFNSTPETKALEKSEYSDIR